MYKHLIGRHKEDVATVFSAVPANRTRENGQKLKHRKLHLNIGEHCFCCESHQTLEQVVQRRCGVSTPLHIQIPTRCSPKQPLFEQGGWTKQSPEMSFDLNHSVNLRLQSISKSKSVLKKFH